MNPNLLPLAAVEHGAVYYLSGMLVVLFTLVVLLALMTLASLVLRKLFPYQAPPPPAAPAPAPVAPKATVPGDAPETIEPEIIAAIAAAVATTLSGNHRVVSIRQQSGGWEKAGRQSVLSSHRIR